jgi:lambda repressor-like predicted transcriptional regulator
MSPNHAHEVRKMKLRLRGMTFASIAEAIGVERSAVSRTSLGTSRSKRIERALADALETRVEDLFPDRYPQKEDGTEQN